MDQFTGLAKVLAAAPRVRILKMLELGELCVCYLTDALGLAQPTVSKHLRVLQQAGLVCARKEGLWVHYRLAVETDDEQVGAVLDLVRQALNDEPQVLQDRQYINASCLCCGGKE